MDFQVSCCCYCVLEFLHSLLKNELSSVVKQRICEDTNLLLSSVTHSWKTVASYSRQVLTQIHLVSASSSRASLKGVLRLPSVQIVVQSSHRASSNPKDLIGCRCHVITCPALVIGCSGLHGVINSCDHLDVDLDLAPHLGARFPLHECSAVITCTETFAP
jgi:hypothetical protein